jgi:hypothetical protein
MSRIHGVCASGATTVKGLSTSHLRNEDISHRSPFQVMHGEGLAKFAGMLMLIDNTQPGFYGGSAFNECARNPENGRKHFLYRF